MQWKRNLVCAATLCLAAVTSAVKTCKLPAEGQPFETATPAEVNLNAAAVQKAVQYANRHQRISLQIFRHNCKVATGALDPVTDDIPNNVWSCTKSVISLLTGIAHTQGKLSYNDEIGKYLPNKPGWGDKAHRKITILDLMTETAGLKEAIGAEAATVGLDSSAPQEALAQKIIHPAGSFFEYSQRVPDLLAYVVERAIGQDIQSFAQTHLFDPIGIPKDSYFWLRDRAGNTYGYAWLFIPPAQLARLGLLMQHMGRWNNKQVVPSQYLVNASASSEKNPCYGWLFWTNKGKPCTGANIPAVETFNRYAVPSAPHDLYAMVGALQQNNFAIPSLDMTVTWTGYFGDRDPDPTVFLSAAPGDLYNNFFSLLMKAVEDVPVPHKGFLPPDKLDLDVAPGNYLSPAVLLADVASNPSCNILYCNGGIPTKGGLENLEAIARVL